MKLFVATLFQVLVTHIAGTPTHLALSHLKWPLIVYR